VALGHRRIALVTRLDDPRVASSYTVTSRMAGWRSVLDEAGLEPVVVNATASTEDAGHEAAQAFLDLPVKRRPTAVLAYSDRIAVGVMQAAQDRDLTVPNDLSVVGFDDAFFAEHTRPPLTTVRQDVHRKGAEATSLLMAAIGQAGAQRTDHRLLPAELVVRSSTSRPGRPQASHR